MRLSWHFLNRLRRRRYAKARNLRLHLGCGDSKLPGFVNVDVRHTKAADVVMNLSELNLFVGNVDLLFSNAFFEHLFRDRRVPHLRSARRALSPEGCICYLGLPNFTVIARSYVEKGPGTFGPRFDLYNVYRYTHGDPEQAVGWYLEQLHKSLFDAEEVGTLLRESGFEHFRIFQYAYPDDAHPVPVNLGFFATNQPADGGLELRCREFLERFPDRVLMSTLEFLA